MIKKLGFCAFFIFINVAVGFCEEMNIKKPKFEREDYDKMNLLKEKRFFLYNGKTIDESFYIDYLSKERIAGQSFCNIFFASIKNGKISDIAMTMMSCLENDMKREQQTLNFINEAEVSLKDNKIVFKKGTKTLTLIRE